MISVKDVKDDKIVLHFSEEREYRDAVLYFTKKIKNYFFIPKVRKKIWNGEILFLKGNVLPVGLYGELFSFCKDNHYELVGKELIYNYIKNDKFDEGIFNNIIKEYFETNKKFEIRDYQIDSLKELLKYKKASIEIATGGGKTLLMYLIYLYLKKINELDPDYKILYIVPTLTLVIQTYEKFNEYSNNSVKINLYYGESEKKMPEGDIMIGTYQTLSNLKRKFFSKVKGIVIDEAHKSKIKSILKIYEAVKSFNVLKYTYGVSGSFESSDTADNFTTQVVIGPVLKSIKIDDLVNKGFLSKVNVKILYLDYLSTEDKLYLSEIRKKISRSVSNMSIDKSRLLSYLYKLEKSYIYKSEKRMDFICKYVKFLLDKGLNVLVLFTDIKNKYGYRIYENIFNDLSSGKYNIFYIDGSVTKPREYFIETFLKNEKPGVLVASYGTFSMGVDIPNIDYIILSEGYKSEILVRQSIGRGVRKFFGKDRVNIIDIVDDFSIKKYVNYAIKHALEREKIYIREKFNIEKRKIKL
mgnify:CR=1 FL=1